MEQNINDNEKPIMNITIVGVGDAGNKTIENLEKEGFQNINFIYINTDKKTLSKYDANKSLLLDDKEDEIGAYGNPFIGKKAATDSIEQIKEKIENTKILILTGGLGGGTATGALPIIAKIAKSMRILTIAIVTTPFSYEGTARELNARVGLNELKENCDTVVTISNNRLINNYPDIAAIDAYKLVNNILKNCIKTFINLISKNLTISLSIADLISTIKDKGEAYIGFGFGIGRNKIMRAINGVTNSKIIETSIRKASNIMMYIEGDPTITTNQINEIISIIKQKTRNDNLNVVFGFNVNEKLVNEIRISVIATFDRSKNLSNSDDINNKKLHDSQELLLEIGNTLENELSAYATGELDIPKYDIEKLNNQFDDKDQEKLFISSEENAEDDDIPFFLK